MNMTEITMAKCSIALTTGGVRDVFGTRNINVYVQQNDFEIIVRVANVDLMRAVDVLNSVGCLA